MASSNKDSEAVADQAKFDRDMAEIREKLPAAWWALYIGSLDKGFTQQQSMTLVCSFIESGMGQ